LSMRAPIPAEKVVEYGLVPGQRFAARVYMLREPALSVANVAVQERAGRSTVEVRTGRGFEQREVALGMRGTARSQVLSGLAAGDVVLLSPGGDLAGLPGPAKVADGDASPAAETGAAP